MTIKSAKVATKKFNLTNDNTCLNFVSKVLNMELLTLQGALLHSINNVKWKVVELV